MGQLEENAVGHVDAEGGDRDGDLDLARDVVRALEWDVVVPTDRIRTSVSNGVVTLEGNVDLWRQYDDAERAVRNVTRVRDVRNLLAVERAPVS